ncbi:MAG TPA: hypothetical protein VEF04_11320, partial [Blastocatellia bacterium]|nr:hypothetical protein [Blastocatellia bacterium]
MSEDICANATVVLEGNNDTANRLESNIQFTIGYSSAAIVIDVLCVLIFVTFKGKYERTRLRPISLVVMAMLGSVLQILYGSVQVIVGRNYPCWLTVVLPIMIIPLFGGSILGKNVLLLYLSRFSETSVKAMSAQGDILVQDVTKSSLTMKSVCRNAFRLLSFPPSSRQTPEEMRNDLVHLHFLVSNRGVLALTTIYLLPFLIIALVLLASDPVYTRCNNCTISGHMMIAIVSIGAIIIALGLAIWLKTRRLRDTWGLAQESFFSILFAFVGLLGFMLSQFDMVGV